MSLSCFDDKRYVLDDEIRMQRLKKIAMIEKGCDN